MGPMGEWLDGQTDPLLEMRLRIYTGDGLLHKPCHVSCDLRVRFQDETEASVVQVTEV